MAVALGAVLVVLVVKPWGSTPTTAVPVATWASAPPNQARTADWRRWDRSSLGPSAPDPAWELWASGRTTRIRFVGPADGFAPRPSVGPAETAVIGGPVIELGTADALSAFALNAPVEFQLGAVRLWRFQAGINPERMDLVELSDPWSAAHVRVFGIHARGLPAGTVASWRPGLYRLDLLIEPTGRIRTLMLTVRAGEAPAGPPRPTERPVLEPMLLRRLPRQAELWAFGQLLTGWSRRPGEPTCRVAEIWRARDVDDPCHPTPIGRPTAIGVNLESERVTALTVRMVDPLPGPSGARIALRVEDRPGMAMARGAGDRFADGIYRLEATTARGDVSTWYVEVGPDPLE